MQHHIDLTHGRLPPKHPSGEPSDLDISDIDEFFARGSLNQIRSVVAAQATRLRFRPNDIDHLVLIASELVTNAVRHGGGNGWLRMWHNPTDIYIEVADQGGGIADPDLAGGSQSSPGPEHHRGLWIVRSLADDAVIQSSPRGTTVTIRFARTRR